MKLIKYFFQFIIIIIFFSIFKLIGYKNASTFSSFLASFIGPLFRSKKLIISNYLKSDQYKKAYLFDDSLENILSFAELKSWFTDIKFHPTLVR